MSPRRTVPRPCLHRNPDGTACVSYAEPGRSYCVEHQRDHQNLNRSPSSVASRQSAHRRNRAAVLRHGPPWVCHVCGRLILTADDLDLDHVHPVALGGESSATNSAPAHRTCNRSRQHRARGGR